MARELQSIYRIGTHRGAFHADELLAVAAIIRGLEHDAELVRYPRDSVRLGTCDILIDIGGIHDPEHGKFDHHQRGFQRLRPNNVPMAAFGLVWEAYGAQLCESQEIADRVDRQLAQPIDIIDTGRGTLKWNDPGLDGIPPGSISAMLAKFNPSSLESSKPLDYEAAFSSALVMASAILDREIISATGWFKNEVPTIRQALSNAADSQIIHFPDTIPATSWHDIVIPESQAAYVVYPLERQWRAQAVPTHIGGQDQRHPFPETWGGQPQAELKRITGVRSAIFAHVGQFIVGATTEDGAHRLAELALMQQDSRT